MLYIPNNEVDKDEEGEQDKKQEKQPLVLAGSEDGKVHLWDLQSRESVLQLQAHEGEPYYPHKVEYRRVDCTELLIRIDGCNRGRSGDMPSCTSLCFPDLQFTETDIEMTHLLSYTRHQACWSQLL